MKIKNERKLGKWQLMLVALLVVVLSTTAIAIAAIDVDKAINVDQFRIMAEKINATTLKKMRAESHNQKETDDNIYAGVIEDFVIFDSDNLILDIPNAIGRYILDDVREYIENEITALNTVLHKTELELDSIEWDYVYQNESFSGLFRGISFDAAWVEWGINLPLFVINAAIAVAKGVAWLTGKKAFVKVLRKYIPDGLQVVFALASGLNSFMGDIKDIFDRVSDDVLMRWLSIGGIVANIIDMFDRDGLNGRITF